MARRRAERDQHRRRGRPTVHHEAWSKVSVVLFDRQVLKLDRAAQGVRQHTGQVLNRTGIIRALIDGLFDSGFDIAEIGNEQDLRAQIAARLRASG